MGEFEKGGFLGMVIGTVIVLVIAINFGVIPKAEKLKDECEKDLARNLKCEMVYVKPSIEG